MTSYNELTEQITDLENAQDQLREIVETIKRIVNHTNMSGQANAYLIPALECAIDNEHGWLGGSNCTIEDVIEDWKTKLQDIPTSKEDAEHLATLTSDEENAIEFPEMEYLDASKPGTVSNPAGFQKDAHQDAMDRAERGEMTYAEAAELGIDLDYGDDEFDDTEDDEPGYEDNLDEDELDSDALSQGYHNPEGLREWQESRIKNDPPEDIGEDHPDFPG